MGHTCVEYLLSLNPGQGVGKLNEKGQLTNSLGFSGHVGSIAATQLCCPTEAAMDGTNVNEHGCVPIKFCFQSFFVLNSTSRQQLSEGQSVLTLVSSSDLLVLLGWLWVALILDLFSFLYSVL